MGQQQFAEQEQQQQPSILPRVERKHRGLWTKGKAQYIYYFYYSTLAFQIYTYVRIFSTKGCTASSPNPGFSLWLQ